MSPDYFVTDVSDRSDFLLHKGNRVTMVLGPFLNVPTKPRIKAFRFWRVQIQFFHTQIVGCFLNCRYKRRPYTLPTPWR